jgi:hypothetical protein
MKNVVSITIILLMTFSYLETFAQKKNDKKYKDGYIIRFSDTISCRIYTGYQDNETGHEVTFKYNDGRIISYHPGSVIKGFGFKGDTAMVHYFQIDVPKYWIKEQTNSKAYAEVVIDGHLRLYKYTKIKNSITIYPNILGPGVFVGPGQKKDRSYYIKIDGDDSLYEVGHKNVIGSEYVEREEIVPFFKGQPQIIANVPQGEFIYINKLKLYLNLYNTWFKIKKEEQ